MEIRRIWNLRGPNLWARFPVLEVWIDLGQSQDLRTDAIPGFCDRLLDWLEEGSPKRGDAWVGAMKAKNAATRAALQRAQDNHAEAGLKAYYHNLTGTPRSTSLTNAID